MFRNAAVAAASAFWASVALAEIRKMPRRPALEPGMGHGQLAASKWIERVDMDVCTSSSTPQTETFPARAAPRPPSRLEEAAARGSRAELPRFWPVIQNLVSQELRVRYQRSVLGFFWTLLNPLLMMAILSLVFSVLFAGSSITRCSCSPGMVPWGFFSGSVNECAGCIIVERESDPEDLRSQAGFPAGSNL